MNTSTIQPTITSASVKVMRSYDYCHFEVCLASNDATTPEAIDELRKTAARLADKAVAQYKTAKEAINNLEAMEATWRLDQARKTPPHERTAEERAVIKFYADASFAARFHYDYQDDWQSPGYDDEDESDQ